MSIVKLLRDEEHVTGYVEPRSASGSTRGQSFFSSWASITMMPLGPRT